MELEPRRELGLCYAANFHAGRNWTRGSNSMIPSLMIPIVSTSAELTGNGSSELGWATAASALHCAGLCFHHRLCYAANFHVGRNCSLLAAPIVTALHSDTDLLLVA